MAGISNLAAAATLAAGFAEWSVVAVALIVLEWGSLALGSLALLGFVVRW